MTDNCRCVAEAERLTNHPNRSKRTKSEVRTSHSKYEAQSPCRHAWVSLPDGRTVAFFVNVETGLIVVDVVDADEKGGIEILRKVA